MIIDTAKLLVGIDMLHETLQKEVLVVTFTKKDGTDRVMTCTRNFSLIPTYKHPLPKLPSDVEEIRDPQLFKVFDLEKQEWRSFRYTTVKTMTLGSVSANT